MILKSIFVLLAVCLTLTKVKCDKSPIVNLPHQGQVEGLTFKSRGGREYFGYLGIPFAKPPKRFKNPEPLTSNGTWRGVRDGSKYADQCVQSSFTSGQAEGSENCLYLNVFTNNYDFDSSQNTPTIVYIHGGGFLGGSSGQSSPEYFMDHNLIFVQIAYRLGPFGFLNTMDGLTDGNVGLKDQTMALKWVQDNIHVFGGNKEIVTIFGGSAGAASVSYHLLSPMSKGLFSRAISGSGSFDCPWALAKNPRKIAQNFAQKLACSSSNSADMVKCLEGKDVGDLIGVSFEEYGWTRVDNPFVPSIEFHNSDSDLSQIFLSEDPSILIKKDLINKGIPWITGFTKNEGLALHSVGIMNDPDLLQKLNDQWYQIAPITLNYPRDSGKTDEISRLIYKFYFGSKNLTKTLEIDDKLEQLYSDRNFIQGIRNSVKSLAGKNPVYPYIFEYKGAPGWLETLFGYNITEGKVGHGDDFAYYFNFILNPQDPNEKGIGMGLDGYPEAQEMSKKFVKFLVDFAKDGTIPWPRTSVEESKGQLPLKWYHINVESKLELESQDMTNRMKFWDEILPNPLTSGGGNKNRIEL